MAGIAMVAIAGASGWLINQENTLSVRALLKKDASLQAVRVSSALHDISTQISGLTNNALLLNALFDSIHNERYLIPFLNSIQRIHGIPVEILFTDFQGREIASNGNNSFSKQELNWLREKLLAGQPTSREQHNEKGEDELIAVEFILISKSVEGALLYKIKVADIPGQNNAQIVHGKEAKLLLHSLTDRAIAVAVDMPLIYKDINFVVTSNLNPADGWVNWRSLWVFFILGVCVVGIVIILGLYFGRRLTRDLLDLEFFARRITEKGFSVSPSEDVASLEVASLEVASLAQSINHMLENLKQEQSKILLLNTSLEERVAQRTAALTEEVAKNETMVSRLIELDKVKNDLIKNVNHELRTPLTSIIGYVDMIIDNIDSDVEPKLTASLAIVQRNALRLQLFVENMMEVSELEFEHTVLVVSTINIGDLLGDVDKTLKLTADDFGVEVTLRLDSPASDLLIDGDINQLEQVFTNLVHNAIKFTPLGGKVTIVARRAHVNGGYVEVKVTDTGIGIPVKEFPNVFNRLFRASTALDAAIPGFGIGLSLVRFIVSEHHGTITFDSTVGEGTVFTVTLPTRYVSTSSPVETT